MKSEDLAWAAGFVDGEGSIMITRAKHHHVLRLDITQKDKTPLLKLQEMFGGSIVTRKDIVSALILPSQKAKHALEKILPYLVVKNHEAQLALDFMELPRTPGKALSKENLAQREAYLWALREAKNG